MMTKDLLILLKVRGIKRESFNFNMIPRGMFLDPWPRIVYKIKYSDCHDIIIFVNKCSLLMEIRLLFSRIIKQYKMNKDDWHVNGK